jgi:hypothetical protein
MRTSDFTLESSTIVLLAYWSISYERGKTQWSIIGGEIDINSIIIVNLFVQNNISGYPNKFILLVMEQYVHFVGSIRYVLSMFTNFLQHMHVIFRVGQFQPHIKLA